MAYTKTTWQDRVVQNPLTYNFQNNADGTTTLLPAEGTITTAGTAITASALNNLETQYDSAVSYISGLAQMVKLTNDSGSALANSQADMNTFTTTGIWYIGTAVTTNLPVTGGYSDNAIVRVSNPSANAVVQEFIYYGGNQAKAMIYTRTLWKPTNTWGGWDRVTQSNYDFGNSLGGNGFQKLPNGLIIQWGRATVPNANMTAFPLPISFTTYLLQATASVINAPSYAAWNPVSNSQIGLYQATGSNAAVSYIAIGY